MPHSWCCWAALGHLGHVFPQRGSHLSPCPWCHARIQQTTSRKKMQLTKPTKLKINDTPTRKRRLNLILRRMKLILTHWPKKPMKSKINNTRLITKMRTATVTKMMMNAPTAQKPHSNAQPLDGKSLAPVSNCVKLTSFRGKIFLV